MWTCTTLSRPIGKTLLYAALALLCPNAVQAQKTQWMQPAQPADVWPASQRVRLVMQETGARIERVDFVLDQASQARTDEAQKKRKAEQRAAAARAKRNAKAASEAASPASGSSRQAARAPTTASAVPAAALPATPAASTPAAARAATAPAPSADTPRNPSVPQQTQANASAQVHGPIAGANAASRAASGAASNAAPGDQRAAGTGRPPRLTRDQLLALVPGSTMLRTNTSGALRQWVNKPDGTLTVYWGGGGVRNGAHSASGNWNVTDEGRLCLHIDWESVPENWCRFIERTANGDYQPIADIADANWTPPADQTYWRPLTIRH